MSSAKVASLYVSMYVCWPISIPLISGFALMRLISASRVRTKISGDKGHPCRVPFDIEKASDR